jgi:GAF domain-containing protein
MAGFSASDEAAALMSLSQCVARDPERALQQLLDSAALLTKAESAGLSLEDEAEGELLLRWVAVKGQLSRYLNGTMPRYFSPCGTAMERRAPLVMVEPARHFPYIGQLHVPVRAVLLIPFSRRGRYIGTLWVVHHRVGRRFSYDDRRAVTALTTFASAILDSRAIGSHKVQ